MTSSDRAGRIPSTDGWRSHAAGELGVGLDSSKDAIRAAFLAQLEQVDFVPPAKLPQAFEVLAGTPAADMISAPVELLDAFEHALSEEIEEFTGAFFRLAVPDRLKQWHRLWQESQSFPLFVTRLDRLKPGLEIDMAGLKDLFPEARELGEHACRLFLLPTCNRTLECESLLDRMSLDVGAWSQAARTLQRRMPQIARLAPQLIRGVSKPRVGTMDVAPPEASRTTSLSDIKIPWWFVFILFFSSFILRACPGPEENRTLPGTIQSSPNLKKLLEGSRNSAARERQSQESRGEPVDPNFGGRSAAESEQIERTKQQHEESQRSMRGLPAKEDSPR